MKRRFVVNLRRLLFVTIIITLLPTLNLVSGVLNPSGSLPTTICDLPYCSCDQKVFCRCTDNMQMIILRSQGFDHLPEMSGSIKIEQCNKVLITKGSIIRMNALRNIILENIDNLELEEEAFSWDTTRIQETYPYPGIDINIINTTIPIIPSDTFQGHINTIVFNNVNIPVIRALAFSNLAGIEKIEFNNCIIDSIEPQSFKKFYIDSFIINGGQIDLLSSHSIIGINIKNILKFENIEFGHIRSNAFKIDNTRIFKLQNCKIIILEGNAFRIITKGPIIIDDNIFVKIDFGAFNGITVDERYTIWNGKQDLVFDNNTLIKFDENALLFNTSGLIPKIDRIVIDKQCSCIDIVTWTNRLINFGTSKVTIDLSRVIWCQRSTNNNNNNNNDIIASDYLNRYCNKSVTRIYWIITILIIVLILLILLCSIGFWLYRRHARRYMNVPTNDNIQNRYSSHNNHVIVIPEGKTYRETELHVIEERVEPIKEYVPPQIITQPM